MGFGAQSVVVLEEVVVMEVVQGTPLPSSWEMPCTVSTPPLGSTSLVGFSESDTTEKKGRYDIYQAGKRLFMHNVSVPTYCKNYFRIITKFGASQKPYHYQDWGREGWGRICLLDFKMLLTTKKFNYKKVLEFADFSFPFKFPA